MFDFDGLILETETPVYEAWAEVFRHHGLQLSIDFWRTIIGRSNAFDPIADIERRTGTRLDRAELLALRRAREKELVERLEVEPGVLDLRAEARAAGVRLAIASSSSRAWVVGHVERLGIADGWECIRTRDDVRESKPAPDLYVAALDCLGVEAGEALAIEDSPHGITAARAAGLHTLAVPGPLTRGLDFSHADRLAPSLAGVTLEWLAAPLGGVSRSS